MNKETEKEIREHILETLNNARLAWYGGQWWQYKNEWFKQFSPETIDSIAKEMAEEGIIMGCSRGFHRNPTNLKEKIIISIWGQEKTLYNKNNN